MKLTCPHCDYSRQIDPEQIPPGTVRVKCPLCLEFFALPRLEEQLDEAPEQEQPAPAAAPQQSAPPGSAATQPPGSSVIPGPPAGSANAMAAVPKAGFWMRVVATLVDAMIVFVLQFLLGALLAGAGTVTSVGSEVGVGETAFLVHFFSYAISFAYYIFFTGYCGQTPGKMVLRIKVVRTDGSPVGYGRAAFREVPAKFLSGIIFGIGYLMVAFDDQKRGLHDRLADTYVIKL